MLTIKKLTTTKKPTKKAYLDADPDNSFSLAMKTLLNNGLLCK